MKRNKKIIKKLNELLTDELTSANQQLIHSEMCHNWGYKSLKNVLKTRSSMEMKHAEKLISRIIHLKGKPKINTIKKLAIGTDLLDQFKNEQVLENKAIKLYTKSISLAKEKGDIETAKLLQTIITEEKKHTDWLDTQLALIKQTSLESYLADQI